MIDRRKFIRGAAYGFGYSLLADAATGRTQCDKNNTLLANVTNVTEGGARFPHFQSVPVPYSSVKLEDSFWRPRQKAIREVTVGWASQYYDSSGGLNEFKRDPSLYQAKPHVGDLNAISFMEGMASIVGLQRDPSIEAMIDQWANVLIAGQGADGYLQTGFPKGGFLGDLDHPAERWAPSWYSHELWTIGKYIEAAVAYREATGREVLYESAIRAADNLVLEFLGNVRPYPGGHAEIEQALTRLYGATGNRKYLNLCGWMLGQRGHYVGRPSFTRYCQDHLPLESQRTIEGHAVAAGLLFNGATEYVGATGSAEYREAVLAVWEDLEKRKMYLHGVGGNISTKNEGYSTRPYRIPPNDAYGESCSVVANFHWAHNLFRLTGAAGYLDTAERMLYNAFYASLSLRGDGWFYSNYAQVDEATPRATNYSFCCIPNILKLFSRVGGYFYTINRDGIYVKHYGASEASIPFGSGVRLIQKTNYPWSGDITLRVIPNKPTAFALRLRIPAWARSYTVSINGKKIDGSDQQKGWLIIRRNWTSGDEVELSIPMNVMRVTMPPEFKEYRNLAALQRGPIVYCLEEQDIGANDSAPTKTLQATVWPFGGLYMPEGTVVTSEHRGDFLGGVTVLRGQIRKLNNDGSDVPVPVMFVPYGVWNNRTPGAMRTWFVARKVPLIEMVAPMGPPGLDECTAT